MNNSLQRALPSHGGEWYIAGWVCGASILSNSSLRNTAFTVFCLAEMNMKTRRNRNVVKWGLLQFKGERWRFRQKRRDKTATAFRSEPMNHGRMPRSQFRPMSFIGGKVFKSTTKRNTRQKLNAGCGIPQGPITPKLLPR